MELNCGIREMRIGDRVQGSDLLVYVLYPTTASDSEVHFGPFSIVAAVDAPASDRELPLVVISHGNGGTPWAFRDLAKYLARSGFVVAMPEHTGNSRTDNTLTQTAANLENRPRHITLTIDAVLSDPFLRSVAAKEWVGMIGHSIGAYTALSLAGGKPWAGAHETKEGKPKQVPVHEDRRITALVLLMPASFWFAEGSLKDVHTPVFIRTGSMDKITPASPHADIVVEGVANPKLVEHQSIIGAGHHSVLSKFPASLTSPDFPPSQDPPGFDREAYQPTLFVDIANFFRRTLAAEADTREDHP